MIKAYDTVDLYTGIRHPDFHIDDKTYTLDTILKNPELFCSLVEHENDLLALDTLS